jgi:hypothetical protein
MLMVETEARRQTEILKTILATHIVRPILLSPDFQGWKPLAGEFVSLIEERKEDIPSMEEWVQNGSYMSTKATILGVMKELWRDGAQETQVIPAIMVADALKWRF